MCPPHVLIVEDNQLSAAILKTIFKKQNVTVTIASCGAQAILLTHDHNFNAIIVDYMLPDGTIDQIVQTLMQNNPKAYFHAVTGDTRQETLKSLRQIGITNITFKPFKPVDIVDLCNHIKTITDVCGVCPNEKKCKIDNLGYFR